MLTRNLLDCIDLYKSCKAKAKALPGLQHGWHIAGASTHIHCKQLRHWHRYVDCDSSYNDSAGDGLVIGIRVRLFGGMLALRLVGRRFLTSEVSSAVCRIPIDLGLHVNQKSIAAARACSSRLTYLRKCRR